MSKVISIEEHRPGMRAEPLNPGDLLFVEGQAVVGALIKLSQLLRMPEEFAEKSHVAISRGGDQLQEALAFGVEVNPLEKYDDFTYTIVRFNFTPEAQNNIMNFLNSVLEAPYRRKYGYVTVASIFLTYITDTYILPAALLITAAISSFFAIGWTVPLIIGGLGIFSLFLALIRFQFTSANTAICSGLAAETLRGAGEIYEQSLTHISPGEMLQKYVREFNS